MTNVFKSPIPLPNLAQLKSSPGPWVPAISEVLPGSPTLPDEKSIPASQLNNLAVKMILLIRHEPWPGVPIVFCEVRVKRKEAGLFQDNNHLVLDRINNRIGIERVYRIGQYYTKLSRSFSFLCQRVLVEESAAEILRQVSYQGKIGITVGLRYY